MKKKALLLAVLSIGLILGSCGGDNPTPSSSADSTDSSGTVDTARRTALRTFMNALGPNNVTMTTVSTGGSGAQSAKRYYFGADAFMVEDVDTGEQSGILVNGNQGLFYFTFENGEVVVDSCAGLGNNITSYLVTPSMLTDDKYLSYLKLDGEGFVYEYDVTEMIKDVRYLYYTCAMLGITGTYYQYVSSLSLTLNEDGTQGRLSMKVKNGATTITSVATFTNIGTTANEALSTYLANPDVIATPTDFSDATKTVMANVFGEHASDVLFPTGLVTAAFADSPLVQNNAYVGVGWNSYGKNLKTAYGKLLKAAGYMLADSGEGSDGLVHDYYQKEIAAQDEESHTGATYIVADLSYYSSTSEFSAYFYKSAGAYSEEYDSIANANAKGIAYINEKATYDIPELPATDKAIINDEEKILFMDRSGIETDYSYFFAMGILFGNKEDALAYLESYVDLLEATHYLDSQRYTIEDDDVLLYFAPSTTSPRAALQLGLYQDGDTYSFELIAYGV